MIYVDTTLGSDGDGSEASPFNSWASALATGLKRFYIVPGSSITLTSAGAVGLRIEGYGWTLALNGKSLVRAWIEGAIVSGVGTGTATNGTDADAPRFVNCVIKTVTLPPCLIDESIFSESVFTLGADGHYFARKCTVHEIVGGSGGLFLNFSGRGAAICRFRFYGWYGGRAAIRNLDNSSGNIGVTFDNSGGTVTIESTCASASIETRGVFERINQGTGTVWRIGALAALETGLIYSAINSLVSLLSRDVDPDFSRQWTPISGESPEVLLKQPDEDLVFGFDFRQWLVAMATQLDSVVSVVAVPDTDDEITLSESAINGTADGVSVRIAGGVAGKLYVVTVTCTTVGGDTIEATGKLYVKGAT